jgi:hypothetical protein
MSKHSSEKGFTAIEAGILAVAVVLTGVLGWKFYEASTNKQSASNASQIENLDMQTSDLDNITDLAAIRQAATTSNANATVEHIELELNSDSKLVYKVQLSDGTVSVYSAHTGELIKTVSGKERTSEALPSTFNGGIGFARALEIAKANRPDSKVFKIELELESGVVVYSVRFGDKSRVDVNAEDGSIVRTKASTAEKKAAKTEEKANKEERKAAEKTTKQEQKAAEKEIKEVQKSTSSNQRDDRSGNSGSGSRDDDSDKADLSDSDDDDDDDDKDDDNSGSGSRN